MQVNLSGLDVLRWSPRARSLGPGSVVGGKRAKRQKTGSNRKNIGERRSRLSARFAGRFFSPFSPNAEPGPRPEARKEKVVAHGSSSVI